MPTEKVVMFQRIFRRLGRHLGFVENKKVLTVNNDPLFFHCLRTTEKNNNCREGDFQTRHTKYGLGTAGTRNFNDDLIHDSRQR